MGGGQATEPLLSVLSPLQSLELRTKQAVDDNLALSGFLYRLLADEVERREAKQLMQRDPGAMQGQGEWRSALLFRANGDANGHRGSCRATPSRSFDSRRLHQFFPPKEPSRLAHRSRASIEEHPVSLAADERRHRRLVRRVRLE